MKPSFIVPIVCSYCIRCLAIKPLSASVWCSQIRVTANLCYLFIVLRKITMPYTHMFINIILRFEMHNEEIPLY